LKYITLKIKVEEGKTIIPYDLVAYLLELISQITKKSKAMLFDVDIPQFLNIFT